MQRLKQIAKRGRTRISKVIHIRKYLLISEERAVEITRAVNSARKRVDVESQLDEDVGF